MTTTFYTKQPWNDGPAGLTPITAATLNHIEAGIANAIPDGSAFADAARQTGVDPTGATEPRAEGAETASGVRRRRAPQGTS